MGVLNITPDSFSDGGALLAPEAALAHAQTLCEEGADIVDVGGESTRPGALAVSAQEEMDRVVPIIEALAARLDVVVSVDTSKPQVMREAVRAGAGLINDVYALRQADALSAAAALQVPVCLMHMQGEPGTMQRNPVYTDVVREVDEFLAARVRACQQAGIGADRLLIDPGFGFGKLLAHNIALLKGLRNLMRHHLPILVGLSRKGMIGQITGAAMNERAYGSAAAALLAVQQGASIVRVHDVRATRQVLAVLAAVSEEQSGEQHFG
ncbi:MAG: dihydropteroate synthase [Gammaproteobacteria bacterium]|nr:dihydropteroate synthase [Gammaproteobacteria bacterium]